MHDRVSVYELQQYWSEVEKLLAGQTKERVYCIPGPCLPTWNDICSELDWELYLLEGGHFSSKHHGYWGVYRLVGLATEHDLTTTATLSRLCGQDTTGTLYIGHSNNLSDRLNKLRRSAMSNEESHNAIRVLRSIPILKFPSNRLAIALLFTSLRPRRVESDLIECYVHSFGDAPPLNYQSR